MERVAGMGDVAVLLLEPLVEAVEVKCHIAGEVRVGEEERAEVPPALVPDHRRRPVSGVHHERHGRIEHDPIAELESAHRGDSLGAPPVRGSGQG